MIKAIYCRGTTEKEDITLYLLILFECVTVCDTCTETHSSASESDPLFPQGCVST